MPVTGEHNQWQRCFCCYTYPINNYCKQRRFVNAHQ